MNKYDKADKIDNLLKEIRYREWDSWTLIKNQKKDIDKSNRNLNWYNWKQIWILKERIKLMIELLKIRDGEEVILANNKYDEIEWTLDVKNRIKNKEAESQKILKEIFKYETYNNREYITSLSDITKKHILVLNSWKKLLKKEIDLRPNEKSKYIYKDVGIDQW